MQNFAAKKKYEEFSTILLIQSKKIEQVLWINCEHYIRVQWIYLIYTNLADSKWTRINPTLSWQKEKVRVDNKKQDEKCC